LGFEQFGGPLLIKAFLAFARKDLIPFLEYGINADAWIISGLPAKFYSPNLTNLWFAFRLRCIIFIPPVLEDWIIATRRYIRANPK